MIFRAKADGNGEKAWFALQKRQKKAILPCAPCGAEKGRDTVASQTRNLTTGSIPRVILQFAAPLFLSQLFQQLYNSVDSLIVGNFLGKQALAAVSSSGSLVFLLVGFFAGISIGAGVVISRHFGAGEQDKVLLAIHTAVAFGLAAGALLTVISVALTPHILRWMGTAPDVIDQSIAYFRVFSYGGIPLVMYNTLTGIMRALGDSRRPLYYLIFSSVLNVILDLVFVAWLGWGVGAAAAATAIAQGVSMVLCFRALMKKGNAIRLDWRKIAFDGPMLKEIVRNGIPSGVQNSVISIANVLVQSHINSFGSDAMAACGSYSKLEGFGFLPIMSFTAAITTVISQNLGARLYDRARQAARFGIVACVAMAEVIGVVLFVLAPQAIALFNNDPNVIAIGVTQIRIEGLFFCFLSFAHCVAAVCRGAGKATVPMVVMLCVWCVLRIAYITAAMHIRHDIRLLFAAYPLTWAISSVIFYVYYRRSDWVHGFEKAEARR